ncbi:DNA-cytosine methyltransferase (EC 2.1.1.37) [uncultured Gammaproteobacteria bacterium]|uniref:DNA cytosine methyltransferase n=1 Tax=Bathymodiolus heckerae thiotrophic gill symbiont TaxID=1052212 RepID=UPI0010B44180|nr:DNA cytosine methyltransferase [Bathymodiolus heckerae thiotrophic gill symbiont]CAC9438460.1 DNA-cytosine methyltransferase (EC 2.1.1.37) [uncultured Gammaproteobacteria bacterium]CAC9441190.1 DNA-cytosine methyltransferase (EC 2.1.1.37) [uncultured Gammaproteobacteria bacterium]SMN13911.1 DNA-cytosine methyltransferase [Bathymodiolus heckerae thiotrophic gill symbiont]
MIDFQKFIAVELFSGAGGLSIGLESAGFQVILANEIERDFAKSFALNHLNSKILCNDIHAIDFQQELRKLSVSHVDLVSGGPPCQGFSTVGSKNKKDPRNSLFYEYLRAVNEINPNYIIFENVTGFSTMYNGFAYRALIQELDFMGYYTTSSILEASDFGLPQIRKRTIVVGWKKTLNSVKLPTPTHLKEDNLFGIPKKLTLMDAISDLPKLNANDSKRYYLQEPQNEYQYKLRNKAKRLTEHNSSNYGEKMLEILSLIPKGGTVNDLPQRLRPKKYFSNTYARLFSDQPTPTITRNFGTPSSSRCVHPFQNRALSTREGARLQGFPDTYLFYGSKTSKNLQIGNAVPPIFGEVIAKEIIKSMDTQKVIDKTLGQACVVDKLYG